MDGVGAAAEDLRDLPFGQATAEAEEQRGALAGWQAADEPLDELTLEGERERCRGRAHRARREDPVRGRLASLHLSERSGCLPGCASVHLRAGPEREGGDLGRLLTTPREVLVDDRDRGPVPAEVEEQPGVLEEVLGAVVGQEPSQLDRPEGVLEVAVRPELAGEVREQPPDDRGRRGGTQRRRCELPRRADGRPDPFLHPGEVEALATVERVDDDGEGPAVGDTDEDVPGRVDPERPDPRAARDRDVDDGQRDRQPAAPVEDVGEEPARGVGPGVAPEAERPAEVRGERVGGLAGPVEGEPGRPEPVGERVEPEQLRVDVEVGFELDAREQRGLGDVAGGLADDRGEAGAGLLGHASRVRAVSLRSGRTRSGRQPTGLTVEDATDGVRTLRMDRAAARNAMDTAMLVALVDALAEARADDRVRGVLLTGAGGVFSAGADVREDLTDGGARRTELFNRFYEDLSLFPKPTAAAVEGPAVGGGAEAAAACDLRAAGASARFRFPGASYGIPVGAARTIGLVGLGTAKDWVLSCRDVPAEEAAAAGFVQRLVDDGEAEAAARGWLVLVGTRDRGTVVRLKEVMNAFAGLPDRVAWENDALRAHQESGGAPPRSRGAFGMPGAARDA